MACASLLTDDNILRFRTKACLRLAQGSCSFGDDRCQYSHSHVWTRRSPFYATPTTNQKRPDVSHLEPLLRYLPVPCDNLVVADGQVVKVKCPRGVNCPFSHSTEEITYHPMLYKTVPCKAFAQRACRVYYCWKSHGERERRRTLTRLSLGIVRGVDVAINFPGVKVVEMMPNKNGRKRRSRGLSLPPEDPSAGPDPGNSGCSGNATGRSPGGSTEFLLERLVEQLTDLSIAEGRAPAHEAREAYYPTLLQCFQNCEDVRKWSVPSTFQSMLDEARGKGFHQSKSKQGFHGCPLSEEGPKGNDGGDELVQCTQSHCLMNNTVSLQDSCQRGSFEEVPMRRRTAFLYPGGAELRTVVGSQNRTHLDDLRKTTGGSNLRGSVAEGLTGPFRPHAGASDSQTGRFHVCNDFSSNPGGTQSAGRHFGPEDRRTLPWGMKGPWGTTSSPLPADEADNHGLSPGCRSPSSAGGSIVGACYPGASTRASDSSGPDVVLSGIEQEQYDAIKRPEQPPPERMSNDDLESGQLNRDYGALHATRMSLKFPSECYGSCTEHQFADLADVEGFTTAAAPVGGHAKGNCADRCRSGCLSLESSRTNKQSKRQDEVVQRILKDLQVHYGISGGGFMNAEEENRRLMTCVASLLEVIQEQDAPDVFELNEGCKGGRSVSLSVDEACGPAKDDMDAYSSHGLILRGMARLAA